MRHTFFKILFLLLSGIVLGRIHPVSGIWPFLFILAAFLSCFVLRLYKQLPVLYMLLFCTGFVHVSTVTNRDVSSLQGESFKVRIFEKYRFGTYLGHVEASLSNAGWIRQNRDILLYLDDNRYDRGDAVLIEGRPFVISEKQNITGWTEYLQNRHVIYAVRASQQVLLEEPLPVMLYLRNIVENRIDDIFYYRPAAALLKGILLGSKAELDEDVIQNFRRSGGMHVLAVSGLHVSIIFLFIRMILFPLPGYPAFRYLKLFVSIAALWLYAGVAGNVPSVNRAVTFFSLFGIGELTARKAFLVHILPLTAVLLWLLDPLQVFLAGFQLSFGAVLGITIFQPFFEKWISNLQSVARYLLRMVTLSLSAQSLTWPLVAAYFGGVPATGIVVSVFLMPAVLIIVLSSLTALILSDIPVLGKILVQVSTFAASELLEFMDAAGDHAFYFDRIPSTVLITALLMVILVLFTRSRIGIFTKMILAIFSLSLLLTMLKVIEPNKTIAIESNAGKLEFRYGSAGIAQSRLNVISGMELLKFGTYRIFITGTAIPAGIVADVIILNGDVPSIKVPGDPLIVISSRVPYYRRREWEELGEKMGWRIQILTAGPVSIE